MTLWTKGGAQPQELPWYDHDPSGTAWTNLETNPEGRAATGWINAPPIPANDPDETEVVWSFDDWLVRQLTNQEKAERLATSKSEMYARIADIRWQRMQSMVYLGQLMPTDDVTAGRCTAAEAFARNNNLDYDMPRLWKISDGNFTTLTTNQIIKYGLGIGKHIQACFDREANLTDQIKAAANVQALRAIDIQSDWPQ